MQIFGHRGYPTVAPENTMPSFEAAKRAGAKALEFDVTLSKDGEVFLLHDRTLDRTTNAQGIARQKNWSDLKMLDAGSWFSKEFEGTRLPLLEEVLSTYGKDLLLNIEIKKEAVTHRLSGGVEEKVLALVTKYKLESSVIISSFCAKAVKRLALMNPKVEVAFLRARPLRILPSILIKRFHAHSLHLPVKGLREKEVKLALAQNIPLRVYTVNHIEQARRLKAWGVTGIYTDQMEKISQALS